MNNPDNHDCPHCGREEAGDPCPRCGYSEGVKQGKFLIEIEWGNQAMVTRADVGAALRELGEKIDGDRWYGEDTILDANGQSVGRWTFHGDN